MSITTIITHFSEPHWPMVNRVAAISRALELEHVHCASSAQVLARLNGDLAGHRILFFADEGLLDFLRDQFTDLKKVELSVVVFISSGVLEFIEKAKGIEQIKYVVGSTGSESIGREISTLIRKFRDEDILDLEKYLAFGAAIVRREVNSLKAKQEVTDSIYKFISGFGKATYDHPFEEYARRVSDMVDELLLNAIYHEKGRHAKAGYPLDFVLSPEEQVAVAWGFDGENFGVSVRDPFGTFTREMFENSISKQRSIDDILSEERGGLGLKIIFETAHQVVANVVREQSSEIIVLVQFDSRIQANENRKKSFFFFSDSE